MVSRYLLFLFAFASIVSTISFGMKETSSDKSPLGENADYLLDTNPKRTSKMIKSGKMRAEVVDFIETTSVGPAFEVDLDYIFKLGLLGSKEGTQKMLLKEEFFTEAFMIKLRKEKHYEDPYLKADYLGLADVTTLDEKSYPGCDKVLFYDIKKPPQLMRDLFSAFLERDFQQDNDRAEIGDLKALVHIYPGIPVLGGVKIDVTGTYSGTGLKFGVDYIAK